MLSLVRTLCLLPKSLVGIASSGHRGLQRLGFCFPPFATCVALLTHPSRAALARPYSFVKLCKPWPGTSSTTSALEFSSNVAMPLPAAELLVLSPPAVGNWLVLSSALVIVVGGVTRLTESGLSITEWRPVTGVLAALSCGVGERV